MIYIIHRECTRIDNKYYDSSIISAHKSLESARAALNSQKLLGRPRRAGRSFYRFDEKCDDEDQRLICLIVIGLFCNYTYIERYRILKINLEE